MRKQSENTRETYLSKFINYTSFIDFIGEKPEFFISGSKRSKTFLGGFLSFLIIALSLLGFFYFGQDIVFKNIPNISTTSIIDKGDLSIKLNKYNFIFLLGLLDNTKNFINYDTDYFNIRGEINLITNNKSNIGDENSKLFNKIEKKEIELVKCNEILNEYNINEYNEDDSFKINRYDEILSKINLTNYICLKNSIDIFGNQENDKLNFLEIKINPCFDFFGYLIEELKIDKNIVLKKYEDIKNFENFDEIKIKTDSNDLEKNIDLNYTSSSKYLELLKAGNLQEYFEEDLSKELITRKICPLKNLKNIKDINDKNSKYNKDIELYRNGQFIFKYINTNFDEKNSNNFAVFTLEEYRSVFEKDYCKDIDIYIKKIKYKTDDGIFFESYMDSSFHNMEKINKIKYKSNKTNINLRINANKISNTIFRKYCKIQMLVAELGGCFVSFLFIALFLNYFNKNAKFYEKLIDELFDVDDLYKYSQLYNSTKKINIKSYRDSIMLRNTKDMENYRKTINKRADMKIKSTYLNNYTVVESSDNLLNVNFNHLNYLNYFNYIFLL